MIARSRRHRARAALVVGAAMVTLAGCASDSQVATPASAASKPPSAPIARSANPPRIVPLRVTFDSLDRNPATGAPVRLTGLLFRPADGGDGRRPAVIAFHGCGGMYSAAASRRESLSLRNQ